MPNKPPPGYSLEDVPDFLKATAGASKVVIQPPNGIDIAKVTSTDPNTVQVNQRDQFGQPELNHEETHVFDFSRNPAIVTQMEADLASGRLPKIYTYGGAEGLLRAQREGKTIADFGPEQRAEMVRNYAQESKQAILKGDAATLDKLNLAYGRLLNQEANLPGKNDSMTTMTQKDLTPAAPGLPSAMESGILTPLQTIGGRAGVMTTPPGGSANYITQSFQGKQVPGMVAPGNIDIANRPNIKNPDGSHSTVFSMSFGTDKGEVLVPGVGDGVSYPLRKLTPKEALDQYRKTGKSLGTFKTPRDADAYAQKLHKDQAKYGNKAMHKSAPTTPKGYTLEQ